MFTVVGLDDIFRLNLTSRRLGPLRSISAELKSDDECLVWFRLQYKVVVPRDAARRSGLGFLSPGWLLCPI